MKNFSKLLFAIGNIAVWGAMAPWPHGSAPDSELFIPNGFQVGVHIDKEGKDTLAYMEMLLRDPLISIVWLEPQLLSSPMKFMKGPIGTFSSNY